MMPALRLLKLMCRFCRSSMYLIRCQHTALGQDDSAATARAAGQRSSLDRNRASTSLAQAQVRAVQPIDLGDKRSKPIYRQAHALDSELTTQRAARRWVNRLIPTRGRRRGSVLIARLLARSPHVVRAGWRADAEHSQRVFAEADVGSRRMFASVNGTRRVRSSGEDDDRRRRFQDFRLGRER